MLTLFRSINLIYPFVYWSFLAKLIIYIFIELVRMAVIETTSSRMVNSIVLLGPSNIQAKVFLNELSTLNLSEISTLNPKEVFVLIVLLFINYSQGYICLHATLPESGVRARCL